MTAAAESIGPEPGEETSLSTFVDLLSKHTGASRSEIRADIAKIAARRGDKEVEVAAALYAMRRNGPSDHYIDSVTSDLPRGGFREWVVTSRYFLYVFSITLLTGGYHLPTFSEVGPRVYGRPWLWTEEMAIDVTLTLVMIGVTLVVFYAEQRSAYKRGLDDFRGTLASVRGAEGAFEAELDRLIEEQREYARKSREKRESAEAGADD